MRFCIAPKPHLAVRFSAEVINHSSSVKFGCLAVVVSSSLLGGQMPRHLKVLMVGN